MKRIFLICTIFFLLIPSSVFANELLEQQLENLELDEVEGSLDDGTSFSTLTDEVLSGEFDFSFDGLLEMVSELVFGELRVQKNLLSELLIVVILSAILRQTSGSLYGKSVGEMGFYVCYMVLIVLITTSFYEICDSVVGRINQVCLAFTGMVPIFLILTAAGGGISKATLLGPTIMGGSAILSWGVNTIVVPAILLAIAMEMANHITEKPLLAHFSALYFQTKD